MRISPGALRWTLRLAVVTLGGVQAWVERHGVSPDGVSYLNVSDGWASGTWSAGINAYWSPLYPALLGLARSIVNPAPQNEAALLHVVNFAVFVVSLVGFEMFLSELRVRRMRFSSSSIPSDVSGEPAWWQFVAYGLFAWVSLVAIGVGLSAPDLIGAAALYFAAALTLRILRAPTPAAFAALGVTLGLGYLAKGAFLIVVLVWTTLVGAGVSVRSPIRLRLITPLAFFVVSLPLIISLSTRAGHLSVGDAGRVNRGWHVNRYPFIWTGTPPGSGTPVHAPVLVNDRPRIYAYPGSAGVSYPYFDDPSYWTEGMTPHYDLAKQMQRAKKQVGRWAKSLGPVIVALLVLSFLTSPRTVVLRELLAVVALTVPLLMLLGGYVTIVAEPRFIAAPLTIFILLGFNALRYAGSKQLLRLLPVLAVSVTAWILSAKGKHVAYQSLLAARELSGAGALPHRQFAIASALSQRGLRRGEEVAVLGGALESYWARLVGVRIAAEVHDPAEYWTANDSTRSDVDAKFFDTGARAIIAKGAESGELTRGWQRLPVPGYLVKWAPEKSAINRDSARESDSKPH